MKSKHAKNRSRKPVSKPAPAKPRCKLANLLAQCGPYVQLSADTKAWIDMLPVGKELYEAGKEDEALGVLADAAMAAADRAADSIDKTLSYVDASNKRIATMEAKAIKDRKAWDLMVPVGKEKK